jgi:Raf kinase inhibitor-like YbhB/YbcL family protein
MRDTTKLGKWCERDVRWAGAALALGVGLCLGACSKPVDVEPSPSVLARAESGDTMTTRWSLQSTAFDESGRMPTSFTADGRDSSPPFRWGTAPSGTRSFAFSCEDPDAPSGVFVHWVMWNIPETATGLPEGVSNLGSLPDGTRQGTNGFKKTGYGGPSPPAGQTHRYVFTVYALDTVLELPSSATNVDLQRAMSGHVLAESKLVAKYGR